jgi:hypothetical protein
MNQAQLVLMMIGGTAELVAGVNDHYWADQSTEKKQRQRKGRIGRGTYGRNLMAHYDRKRAEAKEGRHE